HVDHAVAVERVVATDRVVDGVLGVAEVSAFEVSRQFANDVEIGGVVLRMVRPPWAGAIRVVVVGGQVREPAPHCFDVHVGISYTSPDPAANSFRVGRVFSPSRVLSTALVESTQSRPPKSTSWVRIGHSSRAASTSTWVVLRLLPPHGREVHECPR